MRRVWETEQSHKTSQSWGTTLMKYFARVGSDSTSTPKTRICPDVMLVSVVIWRTREVLPEPLGPSRPRISEGPMVREMPRLAQIPPGYRLKTDSATRGREAWVEASTDSDTRETSKLRRNIQECTSLELKHQ